jgi:hypothetical protein
MKRMRMMGLLLVAVFAISIAASSASANPIFYTKAALGETATTKVPFTATLGSAFLEPASKSKITCTGGTAVGETASTTTTVKNLTKFVGCEAAGTGLKCNSTGKGTGEIDTKLLAGKLGAISSTVPGIRLFDEGEGPGGKLAEFTCGGGAVSVVVRGSVIGSLSGAAGTEPANGKFASSNKLTFAETEGKQKYQNFLSEAPEQLESSTNGGAFEKSGQSVVVTIKSTPAGNLGFTK